MNIDNIQKCYDELRINGWTDNYLLDMVKPFGWSGWGYEHARKDDVIRYSDDVVIEVFDIELYHYYELVGAYMCTGDILDTLKRWLDG